MKSFSDYLEIIQEMKDGKALEIPQETNKFLEGEYKKNYKNLDPKEKLAQLKKEFESSTNSAMQITLSNQIKQLKLLIIIANGETDKSRLKELEKQLKLLEFNTTKMKKWATDSEWNKQNGNINYSEVDAWVWHKIAIYTGIAEE